jgi:hypothetical protein
MFPKIKQFLNKQNILLCVAALLLIAVGYLTVNYLTVKYSSNAAGGVQTGYGCYNYGNSAVYGSCRVKLVNTDIPELNNPLITTGGVVCTPKPAEVNTKISCTGTLGQNRLAPVDVLSIGIEGQPLSACTFVGETFTCPNILVGNTTGAFNLFGKIGNNTAVNTNAEKITVINHTLTTADLTGNGWLLTFGPFSAISCGTNNVAAAGQVNKCTATIRPGYTIPSDFKFGIGTNPGGQCVTTGFTLTCINVPTTSDIGKQNFNVQIGSSAVYKSDLLINVSKEANSTTTPTTPIANAVSANPIATGTSLIRTGGVGLWLVGAILLGVTGWVSATFVKSRKKPKSSSQDK